MKNQNNPHRYSPKKYFDKAIIFHTMSPLRISPFLLLCSQNSRNANVSVLTDTSKELNLQMDGKSSAIDVAKDAIL
jgi:hypothetical protein